jgi:hypothetical protein
LRLSIAHRPLMKPVFFVLSPFRVFVIRIWDCSNWRKSDHESTKDENHENGRGSAGCAAETLSRMIVEAALDTLRDDAKTQVIDPERAGARWKRPTFHSDGSPIVERSKQSPAI